MASIRKLIILIFISISLFWIHGCKTADIELESKDLGIDPAKHPDAFVKLLQTRGRFYDSPMPADGDTTFGFLPINYPKAIDFQTASEIPISFNLQNLNPLFTVDSLFFTIDGSIGHWAVPFTRTGNSFRFEFLIPRTVRKGEFCLQFKVLVKASGRRFLSKPGKVCVIDPPTILCSDSLQGITGITPLLLIKKMVLSEKKGKVVFLWNTFVIPDRFDIKYNNEFVVSSGTLLKEGEVPNCSSDGFVDTRRRYRVYEWDGYDPAISREITIYLHNSCLDSNTEWRFKVVCPQ